jgi:hypothetical protein
MISGMMSLHNQWENTMSKPQLNPRRLRAAAPADPNGGRWQAPLSRVYGGLVDAALQASDDCFRPQIEAVLAEMRNILAGRNPRSLKGAAVLSYGQAQTRLNILLAEQRRYADAELTRRMGQDV